MLSPQGISFPSSRGYAFIARRSPFTRDLYGAVAQEAAAKLTRGRILDVGTGPGYLPIEIARLAEGVEVVGIDISKDMVRIARRNAEKEGLGTRVRFEAQDASSMSFKDSYFHLVVSTASFHHWRNPVAVLNEVHRVLKPGCEAWIYDLRRDVPAEDKEKLKRRYGRLLSWLIWRVVATHSSITREALEETLKQPESRFRAYAIREDYPSVLEVILLKEWALR